MNRFYSYLVVFGILGGGLACDSEGPDEHDVKVGWDISGVTTCETMALPQLDDQALTFETIHIEVFAGKEAGDDLVHSFDVPCDDYSFTLEDLERGTYIVTLDAMAEHDSKKLAFFQAELEIASPAKEDEYVGELRIGTGAVQVQWEFGSGFCVSNDVSTVNVTLTNVNRDTKTTVEDVECASEILLFNNVTWDVYQASVQGFDENGTQTHEGTTEKDFEVLPGSKVKSVVTIE